MVLCTVPLANQALFVNIALNSFACKVRGHRHGQTVHACVCACVHVCFCHVHSGIRTDKCFDRDTQHTLSKDRVSSDKTLRQCHWGDIDPSTELIADKKSWVESPHQHR